MNTFAHRSLIARMSAWVMIMAALTLADPGFLLAPLAWAGSVTGERTEDSETSSAESEAGTDVLFERVSVRRRASVCRASRLAAWSSLATAARVEYEQTSPARCIAEFFLRNGIGSHPRC